MLLAASAEAQPPPLPLQLSWQAPAECPVEAAVHAELSRIVRARPDRALRPLAANVVIRQAADGYHAALHTEHEGLEGERDLRAQDCATLARSVTLVLALAFGPDAEIEPEASSSAPPTAPAATSEVAPTPERAPPEAQQTAPAEPTDDDSDDASGLSVGILLGGGIEALLFPTASPQLQAGVALQLSPVLSAQLRVTALPAVSKTLAGDARARFDGLAAGALGCARVAWLFSACAGARVAALRARGFDLDVDDSAVAPWYALLATLGATWPSSGPLRVGLEGVLGVSLARPRFAVKELGTVHRVPLLAPELSVMLELWP
jgi:hypothetical protein